MPDITEKKKKENLAAIPDKVLAIYIHMKNTYMKIYKK